MKPFEMSHSLVIDGMRYVWNVERLWQLAKELEVQFIDPSSVKALDQNCWYGTKPPTIRSVIEHMQRIERASLEYPVILNEHGDLMDGGHRIAKAILTGVEKVPAVRFDAMPEPDYIAPADE